MEAATDAPPRGFRKLLSLTRTQFLVLLLAGYLGGYIYLRFTKTFIRIQNKGGDQKNLILAPYDPWDDIAWGMTKEAYKKLPIFFLMGAYKRIEKPMLNGVYWPLRKLESLYWNSAGR